MTDSIFPSMLSMHKSSINVESVPEIHIHRTGRREKGSIVFPWYIREVAMSIPIHTLVVYFLGRASLSGSA